MAKQSDDDIRKQRLGIDKLNQDERKQMYEKFVDAGGEALDARTKERLVRLKKAKESNMLAGQIVEKPETSASRTALDTKGKSAALKKSKTQKKKALPKKESSFRLFLMYIKTIRQKLRTKTGNKIPAAFFNEFKIEFQSFVIQLHSIVMTLLHPKEMGFERFKKQYIRLNPYALEILLRIQNIYVEEEYKEIVSIGNQAGQEGIPPTTILTPLREILKRLYILNNHNERMVDACTAAMQFLLKHNQIDKDFIERNLPKIKDSIKYIFDYYLPKLLLLYGSIEKKYIPKYTELEVRGLLGIPADDFIGAIIESEMKMDQISLTDKKEQDVDKTKEEEEKEDKKEEKSLSPDYLAGKDIIDNIEMIPSKFDRKDLRSVMEPNDKIFQTWCILEEFEKQFSFILTSSKINFQIDFHAGKKTDVKKDLNDIYLTMNTSWDEIKDYGKLIEEIQSIIQNKDLSEVQKNNNIHNLNIRQTKASNYTRTKLAEALRRTEVIFKVILENKDRIIQDHGEKLHFDKFDGDKYLEGYYPDESIKICLSFVAYFRYLLTEGKLSGASPNIIE